MASCLNFSWWSKGAGETTIDSLPNEVLIEIFRKLSVQDLIRCAGVCTRWRKLTRDANLWRVMPIHCSAQLGDVEKKRLEMIKFHGECIRCIKFQYILNYSIVKSVIDVCDKLVSLELIMCRVEKDFENIITKWEHLKKFDMKNSLLKSEIDLDIQFDHFRDLTYLGLSDFGLSQKNCESLLHCHNLNYIHIDKIRGLTSDFIKRLVTTKQETLVCLRLYGAEAVDDEVIFMLAKCPKLEEMAVIRCENLSNKSLAAIATYKGLKKLQLWNNNTFAESSLLRSLSAPPITKLRSLSLSRIQNVTSKIVDVIAEYYTNLTFLALYQCPQITNTDYETQLKMKFRNIELVFY